jgi:chromosome segregation ATPase
MTVSRSDWTTLLGVLEQHQARIEALEQGMTGLQEQLSGCVELCKAFENTISAQSERIQALEQELERSLDTLANNLEKYLPE